VSNGVKQEHPTIVEALRTKLDEVGVPLRVRG
jgi:hypothetical protein